VTTTEIEPVLVPETLRSALSTRARPPAATPLAAALTFS
jgi:hypothetical protein